MPVYLTEFGYFQSGHRALPPRPVRATSSRGSTSRSRTARQEPLQYLLVSPQRLRIGLLQHRVDLAAGTRYPQYNALQRWYRKNRGKVKRPSRGDPAAPGTGEPIS